jgi:drug/metabolite transporter (DMT)-like permease
MERKNKGFIFLIITIILFSTFEVTGKMIGNLTGNSINPFTITFERFLIGGIMLFPFAFYKVKSNKIVLNKKHFLYMALIGFINIVVSMGFIQYGLLYTDASIAAVIFSANPVFVSIFAAIILKEKINISNILGMVLGVSGVIVLFADKLSTSSFKIVGPTCIFLSALFYGLYTVVGKKFINDSNIDSLITTSISFILGSLMLLPLMAFKGIPLYVNDVKVLPHMIYLGVLVSGIAYMCYFYGLQNVPASVGSLTFFAKPVLASIIAVILLHERLSFNFYIGTLIIILGVCIVNFYPFGLFRTSQIK